MAILRNHSRTRYTVVSSAITTDTNLSMKGRGLLLTLLSLPDRWDFSEAGLNKILDKDGLTAIKSGLKELEKSGYLSRKQMRDENGRMCGVEWTVCESPVLESPMLENPISVNHTQYNTNTFNPKESNTNNNACRTDDKTNTPLFDGVFSFYSDLYEKQTGQPHPAIKQEQRLRIESVFLEFCNRNYCGVSSLKAMIEDFFWSVHGTDYNINHFACKNILDLRQERIK